MHSKMKRRIVILGLDSGQLPLVLELAILTMGGENLSFAIADHRRNYCNTLHNGCKDKQSFTAAQVGPNRQRLVQPPLLFDDLVGLVDFLELFFGTVLLFAPG